MTKIFEDKIFEARQKSAKSSKILTLENFRQYCILGLLREGGNLGILPWVSLYGGPHCQ